MIVDTQKSIDTLNKHIFKKEIRTLKKEYAVYKVSHVFDSFEDYQNKNLKHIELSTTTYHNGLRPYNTSIKIDAACDNTIMGHISYFEKLYKVLILLYRYKKLGDNMERDLMLVEEIMDL